MRVGLDIHGVLDIYPQLFSHLTKRWKAAGHEIHILTGQEFSKVKKQLIKDKIHFTHHYSIVDYHKKHGMTQMWNDDPRGNGWWMDDRDWEPSKGNYARKVNLDIHFDDCVQYAKFFPKNCTFVLVPPEGFERLFTVIFKKFRFERWKKQTLRDNKNEEIIKDAIEFPFRKLDELAEKHNLSNAQIRRLSIKIGLAKKMREARKEKILGLSEINPTLSADDIAAHFNVSAGHVLKLMGEGR